MPSPTNHCHICYKDNSFICEVIPEYIYVRKITKFIESESKFITNADGELQIIHLNRFCTLWSPMIERSFILSPFVVHVYIFILKPLMEQCVKNIIAGILLLRRNPINGILVCIAGVGNSTALFPSICCLCRDTAPNHRVGLASGRSHYAGPTQIGSPTHWRLQ